MSTNSPPESGATPSPAQAPGAVYRYAVILAGLVVVTFLAIPVMGALASNRGVPSPLLLNAASPLWGMLVFLCMLVLMTVAACLVARQLNAAVGLFVLGFGIGVVAIRSGGVADFAWEEGSLWMLATETIIWSAIIAFLALVVMRVSGGLDDVPHDWKSPSIGSPAALFSKPSLLSVVCGVIALPIAWLLLADDLKGQALGAVIVASFIAGMAGRVTAPRIDPILVYGAPVLAGGIAQLVIASGWSEPPSIALVEGALPRLVWVMPVEWAGGAMIGVSLGIGWARGFIRDANVEVSMSPERLGQVGTR